MNKTTERVHVMSEPGVQSRDALVGAARLGRATFVIGSIGFVAVGALHTATHFFELAGADLEQRFDELGDIDVSGTMATSWDLFQGVSWLMGVFSIALGLMSLSALRAGDGRPPLGACLVNIGMLATIGVIGVAHLGPLQVYGGLFGITMFSIAAVTGRAPSRLEVSPS